MSRYRIYILMDGSICLSARAFLTASPQHTLLQYRFSGSLEPTHCIITRFLTPFIRLGSPWRYRSNAVGGNTESDCRRRYSVGSYSRPPVATTIAPLSI